MHPLAEMLRRAAGGSFPAPDGSVEVLGPPRGRCHAVVAFTAHSVIAAGVPEPEVRARLDPDDLGSPMSAPFLAWLGERLGSSPGMIDALLAAPRRGRPREAIRARGVPGREHIRVERAMRYRTDLDVYALEGGLLVLGRGLAGRLEVAVEVDPRARNRGLGRELAAAAVELAPPGEPVFAQVSPGNAASLRAFLAAGYRPIGSEVLFLRDGEGSGSMACRCNTVTEL